MSDLNPYAPPQADLTPAGGPGAQPLASPWIRLVAQIVDGLIMMAVVLPLQFLTGYFQRSMEAAAAGNPVTPESLLWTPVGIVIALAINWNFLLQGQTVGKKVMKVRIVRKDGSPAERNWIVIRRLLPVWIASIVPVIGGIAVLVDALCIFRAQRNTLHDDIADTKVVTA